MKRTPIVHEPKKFVHSELVRSFLSPAHLVGYWNVARAFKPFAVEAQDLVDLRYNARKRAVLSEAHQGLSDIVLVRSDAQRVEFTRFPDSAMEENLQAYFVRNGPPNHFSLPVTRIYCSMVEGQWTRRHISRAAGLSKFMEARPWFMGTITVYYRTGGSERGEFGLQPAYVAGALAVTPQFSAALESTLVEAARNPIRGLLWPVSAPAVEPADLKIIPATYTLPENL